MMFKDPHSWRASGSKNKSGNIYQRKQPLKNRVYQNVAFRNYVHLLLFLLSPMKSYELLEYTHFPKNKEMPKEIRKALVSFLKKRDLMRHVMHPLLDRGCYLSFSEF